MTSWVDVQPGRWEAEQAIAKSLFAECMAEVAIDGCALLVGTVYVERQFRGKIGPFFLKILYPPNFPEQDPNVYLVSHENWRDESNHVEKDGRFCWSEAKDSPIDFYREESLRLLVENIGFRLMQIEMKVRKKLRALPGPERKHFLAGELEANAERKRRGIGKNTKPCICGRNLKYKHCHGKKEVFRRDDELGTSRAD